MKLRKILTILLIASAFAVGGAVQANAAVQADDPGDISYFSVPEKALIFSAISLLILIL